MVVFFVGGFYNNSGSSTPASRRDLFTPSYDDSMYGCRSTLYIDTSYGHNHGNENTAGGGVGE